LLLESSVVLENDSFSVSEQEGYIATTACSPAKAGAAWAKLVLSQIAELEEELHIFRRRGRAFMVAFQNSNLPLDSYSRLGSIVRKCFWWGSSQVSFMRRVHTITKQ
jgi:hypothetical protein